MATALIFLGIFVGAALFWMTLWCLLTWLFDRYESKNKDGR